MLDRYNFQNSNNLFKFLTAFVLAIIMFFGVTENNHAATFTVNSTADTNDNVCDATDCTLREAVEAANALAGDDTIDFSTAVFGATPQTITLGGTELLVNTGRLVIFGVGANLLTIDGNNQSRIFYVDTPAALAIVNLTVTNGLGVGNDNGFGGGIANRGLLAVDGCVITNNTASTGGGGILNELGIVQIFSSTISNNTTGTFGGGIRSNIGDLTIEDSTFDNNTVNSFGGSIEMTRGIAVINNTNITNSNSSLIGGGIVAQGTSAATKATLEINNSNISGNNANNSAGGILTFFTDATVDNTKFNDNTAGVAGGGIRHDSGNFFMTNSTINNNAITNGGQGGGVANAGPFAAVSSTISNNSVIGFGGGIYNFGSGQVALDNSTVSGNNAISAGGGVFNSASLFLFSSTVANNVSMFFDKNSGGGGVRNQCTSCFVSIDSIIADNIDEGNLGPDVLGELLSEGHNLIEDTTGTTFDGDLTGNITGLDPLLDPTGLKDNGGPTETIALLQGSPAIDSADPTTIVNVDQRGIARPFDGDDDGTARSDIGSFEVDSVLSPRKTKFDFDGDARADLSVFRAGEGNWYLNSSTDGFSVLNFGISSDIITPADFDGDGKTDLAVYRESQNRFYILQSTDGVVRQENFGIAGDDPRLVGDWDGDGKADIAVYRQGSQGSFFYRGSNNNPNGNITFEPWGTNGDKPVRGDFDGDGKLDVVIFRPTNGVWYIRQSSDNQIRYENWGISTDVLVPADFDGDGKTDLAIYRDGVWYIRRSSDNAVDIISFGLANDVPVPADYDGDGEDDIAVYRDGVWYIANTTNGSVSIENFGVSSDTPVPGASQ